MIGYVIGTYTASVTSSIASWESDMYSTRASLIWDKKEEKKNGLGFGRKSLCHLLPAKSDTSSTAVSRILLARQVDFPTIAKYSNQKRQG